MTAFPDLDKAAPKIDDPTRGRLRTMLGLAVPIRIRELQRGDRSADWMIQRAREVADILTEHGAALLTRTPPRTVKGRHLPGTAQVFTALVDGIACGALVSNGGVRAFGLHFGQSVDDMPVPPTAGVGL